MKKFDKMLSKVKLWRTLTIVFTSTAALMYTLQGVCNLYAPLINKALGLDTSTTVGKHDGNEDTYYFKSSYDSLEDMYKAKVSLLRDIGREGTVVLKNDGVLPIKGNNIAVLNENKGFIYETTTAGGTIKINHALCTSLSKALTHEKKNVTDKLDTLAADGTVIVVVGRAYGEAIDASKQSLQLKAEEKQMLDSAIASGKKVVLLVSGDYSIEIGDYASKVNGIIKFGNAGYRGAYGLSDVIVGNVSPSGKLVETLAVDNDSAPASVNFGNFEFTNKNTLKLNMAKNYLIYGEGVYVDYKYYETRYEDAVLGKGNATSPSGVKASGANWSYDREVLYPFGYGLSYTTFKKEIVQDPTYSAEDDTWTMKVKVTNTGSIAGKEVVQVYAQTPYTEYDIQNNVEKPAVSLLGFEKTKTLNPGEDVTVEVPVHQQWLASYDYKKSKGYIMDAGDYYLALGDGSHDAINNILAAKKTGFTAGNKNQVKKITPNIKATATAPDKEIYRYIYNKTTEVTNSFDDVDVNHWLDEGKKITYLSRNDWNGTYPVAYSIEASKSMQTSLNEKKKMDKNVIDTASRAKTDADVKYVDNADYISETAKAINLKGKKYNDPEWKALLDELSIQQMSYTISNGRWSIPALKSVAFPEMPGNDNPTGLWDQYVFSSIDPKTGKGVEVSATLAMSDGITDEKVENSKLYASMFSSEPVLAATFSHELATRQGDFFAEDALYCKKTFVWGLGVNLHRTAYGGRASEYLSADPILSTLIASDWNKASLAKGCIMVSKHFVANEQEVNRLGVCTFLNEQTMREVYLRAFEGVTTYGDLKGIMASYNRIGLISTAAEYDLMTKVLREEWNFDGYGITDLYPITDGLYVGKEMVIAGTDMMLGTGYAETSGTYVTKSLNVENIKASQQLLTAVRESCHRLIYVFVNSNGMNGISRDTKVQDIVPFYVPLIITLEIVFTVVALGSAVMYVFSLRKREKETGRKE